MPEESIRLFKEIGEWMKVNGEAIYTTRANPFNEEFTWGRVARKGDDLLYLIVYHQPENGKITLPCVFKKVKAKVINGKGKPSIETLTQECSTVVDISNVQLTGSATVIKLKGRIKT